MVQKYRWSRKGVGTSGAKKCDYRNLLHEVQDDFEAVKLDSAKYE